MDLIIHALAWLAVACFIAVGTAYLSDRWDRDIRDDE